MYLDEMQGLPVQDIILDIPAIPGRAAEKLGYPTQKPLALLERIVEASSNPGDIVLDPFCGCGTVIEAAETLARQWIGIDITHLAINLIEKRLNDGFEHKDWMTEIFGAPQDLAAARDLAASDRFQFQFWACSLVHALPFGGEPSKGADKGVDGVILFNDEGPKAKAKRIVVSVKSGERVSPSMVRDLRGTVEREGASAGLFITLSDPTPAMTTEAADAGYYVMPANSSDMTEPVPKIQILTVENLLKGLGPKLPLDYSGGRGTFKRNPTVHHPMEQKPIF